MNTEEETLELIDRYLLNSLHEWEKERFNQRMAEDPEFRELVENQKFANKLILGNRLHALKVMMDEDFASGNVQRTQSSWSRGKLWAMAGLVLITAGVLVFFMSRKSVGGLPEVVEQTKVVKQQGSTGQVENRQMVKEERVSVQPAKKEIARRKADQLVKPSEAGSLEDVDVAGIPVDDVYNSSNSNERAIQEPGEPLVNTVVKPCTISAVSAKVDLEPACMDKQDGRLTVSSVQYDGTVSYGLSYAAGDTVWQSSAVFNNLPANSYTVWIKDPNGCRIRVGDMVEIEARDCQVKKQQVYSFSPSYGETVEIKVEGEGTITIWNRAGMVIYNGHIHPGNDFSWSGQTSSGGISAPGVYIYSLEYFNGASEKGEIVIY
jgi:hypothetical protein